MNFKAYFAEFLGTFALVLVGCGVAISPYFPQMNILTVGLAFGLTVTVMIYALGHHSGGHFNPAVSFSMALSKKLSWKDFGFYSLFQLLGAGVSSFILIGFFDTTDIAANEIFLYRDNQALMYLVAILVEVIVTFIFIFVILSVTAKKENQKIAGFVIGLTLALMILLSGSLTNASLNPARSLMPAIFQGGDALNQVWVFIVGPMLGAILATVVYQLFNDKEEKSSSPQA